ncbi:RNA polymerase sigma factor [Paludisphaera soli]|uniref:RNA polymerase sigma factor n=1 Tax=Paludisphaera soli TaxID=2712865 RepID=UPI0013EDDABF|nr:sigma-70 family RNA polymerase sigma factor [Paludisphaera soli]
MIGTVHGLQDLLEVGATGRLSDGQLLDRFVARRDEAVFGAIVDRHGPMVWGVCRRILRDHHDAEDAFQATFLVLARRAGSVAPADRLGAWLHGVALQTALKARANRARRQAREASGRHAPEPSETPREPGDDLAESLDRALAGLPEKYRTPIVLCDLEGRSYAEAAEHLGWPIGTVSGRLCRARAMLAKRLARRGVALSAGALVSLCREAASATFPASRLAPLLRAASLTGRASWTALVSAEAAALSQEVQGGMLMTKFKTTALGLLTAGILATGIGVLAQGQDESPTTQETPAPRPRSKAAQTTTHYYVGDLLFPDPSMPPVLVHTADPSEPPVSRPQVDMSPIIELITSSIEPDHWKAVDGSVRNITPFFLSISLIIRAEPEVHERVSALLMGLRRFSERHAAASGVSGMCFRKTFAVGDLLRSPDDAPGRPDRLDRQALIEMITSTIHPRFWQPTDQGTIYIVSGPEVDTLTVCHTPVGHEQIEALLTSLRRFRDAQTGEPAAK